MEIKELEFTDEEIIKAAECCEHTDGFHCDSCPFNGKSCAKLFPNQVLELINRKNEEIERLQGLLDDKCDRCIERERVKVASEIFADIQQNSQRSFSGSQGIVIMTEKDFEAIKKIYTEGHT